MGLFDKAGDVLGGGIPGAIAGGLIGGVPGAIIGGVGGGILGGIGARDPRTITQSPLQTPEQAAARRALLGLGETGSFGGITLGEDLNLPTGNFELSDLERNAINAISGRFNEGQSPVLTQTLNALSSFLEDPTIDPAGQFAPFRSRVERELEDSVDRFKRESAITGDLFSTNLQNNLADIQTRGQEALTSELANLTNDAINRRFQAVSQAPTIFGLIDDINRGRINDLLNVGGFERTLQNQEVAQQREDRLRQRDEELQRINALNAVLGANVPFGVPEITLDQPNQFQGVFDLLGGIGGNILGQRLGGFGGSSTSSSQNIPMPIFGQNRLNTGNQLSLFA